jgi:hypothetical protein
MKAGLTLYDQYFLQTIENLKRFDEVDAIALGGSMASGMHDSDSDYDLYVYINEDIKPEQRKSVLSQTCKNAILGITFWGTCWDDCILKNSIPIELNYVNIADTQRSLHNILEKHTARLGNSTCACSIVFGSQLLYDHEGLYNEMVERYTAPFPEKLRQNIISVNREYLSGVTPSCMNRIEVAIKRNDVIGVNHRLYEFIKSYFDILFALNRVYHPGEKLLIEYGKKLCECLPENYENDLQALFQADNNEKKLIILRRLLFNLDILINAKA